MWSARFCFFSLAKQVADWLSSDKQSSFGDPQWCSSYGIKTSFFFIDLTIFIEWKSVDGISQSIFVRSSCHFYYASNYRFLAVGNISHLKILCKPLFPCYPKHRRAQLSASTIVRNARPFKILQQLLKKSVAGLLWRLLFQHILRIVSSSSLSREARVLPLASYMPCGKGMLSSYSFELSHYWCHTPSP